MDVPRLTRPNLLAPAPPRWAIALEEHVLVPQQLLYTCHKELICANWGYACETGTHAVRVRVGGVFDHFPSASKVLGHNGETLPFAAWRLQHRMEFSPGNDRPKKRIQDYLKYSVYTTISSEWAVPTLLCTMQVLDTDRILISVHYPFETMQDATEFLDNAPIGESDRVKIAHDTAQTLVRLPGTVARTSLAGHETEPGQDRTSRQVG